MNTKELLEGLEAGLKSISLEDLGDGVLQPEKYDELVKVIKDTSVVLDNIRFKEMDSNRVDIDIIEFGERMLGAIKPDGSSSTKSKASFKTNKLESVLTGGTFGLPDTVARRNIEKGNLENTLVELAGKRVSADIEELGFLGDKDSEDEYLQLTDGWLKKADHQDEVDVDFEDVESILDAFDKAIELLPKAFLKNRADFTFFVDYDVEKAYRDYMKSRSTAKGDKAITGADLEDYEGIKIKYVPALNKADESNILLTGELNMVWGLFHEVTFEPERKAGLRKTEYHVTAEPDFHYENTDAAVRIKINDVTPAE